MPTTASYSVRRIAGVDIGEFHLQSQSGMNPLSSSTVAAMHDGLRRLDTVEPPHAILFRASGRCFCAGADLKEFGTITEEGFRGYMVAVLEMYAAMAEVRKPVISLVHADARGGGAAVALFSDFVIAADNALFALPEVHRGLAGGGYLLPRLVGKQRAAEMVLLGRTYTAQAMQQMGLVTEVCASEALEVRLETLCAELAQISPGAFAVGKRSLAAGLFTGMREAMATHVEAQTQSFRLARDNGLL
ncbi:enoyl-CoA hydratase/isomerase family protein [Chelatococcus reniformis]|uniref:Enoyl-CoA hydratase n=1 Tax=Chelatococcus reniformis TaxID=1494448 RepID=A0A916U5N0_9HYPH|nr:enoyl-CoA hydratase/isomerase family protein [Chelatococcus reniformis]GGC60792.1 enoyl-CoA hydratase [Chelatococcus reniformis]